MSTLRKLLWLLGLVFYVGVTAYNWTHPFGLPIEAPWELWLGRYILVHLGLCALWRELAEQDVLALPYSPFWMLPIAWLPPLAIVELINRY